jgi:hypothetical protein
MMTMTQILKMIEKLYLYLIIFLCIIAYQYEIVICFNLATGFCLALICFEIGFLVNEMKEFRYRQRLLKDWDEKFMKILKDGQLQPFNPEKPHVDT